MMRKHMRCRVPVTGEYGVGKAHGNKYNDAIVEEIYPNHILCSLVHRGEKLYRQSFFKEEIIPECRAGEEKRLRSLRRDI